METRYRITFRGDVIEGHIREQVMETAAARLGASVEQARMMFSGRVAILKKNLDQASAERYVALLARIGMRATAEPMPETPVAPAASPSPAAPPAKPAPSPVPVVAAEDVLAPPDLPNTPSPQFNKPPAAERTSGVSEAFDPERTHLASHNLPHYGMGASSETTAGVREAFDPTRAELAEQSVLPTRIVPRKPAQAKPGVPAPQASEEANPDHLIVATYLDSIQALTAETRPHEPPEIPPQQLKTEIRATPLRAMAHLETKRPAPNGPPTITPEMAPQLIKLPVKSVRLPDPPTHIPDVHGATTIMVMGPDSDTPVPTSKPPRNTTHLIAIALGGAALIAVLAWFAFG
ncbi:hypothetical protein OPU71_02775 [Niveibacterium sp. 24ML]|uniref:hypothetical protein n=1 Tax=Niveibacterium sp. 24ML TaxID=2985512 RepID=UPI0022721CC5|nr:hypothetical protein [Niveibacterium sp. 24ML]MCX9155046.1 hypothetical protein [Niveibacterium sp. 24ML]